MAKRIKSKQYNATNMNSKERMSLIRATYKSLQDEANARVEALKELNLLDYSKAYNDAVTKTGFYRTTDDELTFDIYDTKRYREVKREVALIEKFLNDPTSTPEGAKEAMLNMKYKGAFSGKWSEKYGVTYDTERIETRYAKTAFSIYRRLEENKSAYNKIIGEHGYGSENLIMAIYDMVVEERLDVGTENDIQYWDKYGEVLEKMSDLLDREYEQKVREAKSMYDTGDEDTGLLYTVLSKAATSEDYINKLFF